MNTTLRYIGPCLIFSFILTVNSVESGQQDGNEVLKQIERAPRLDSAYDPVMLIAAVNGLQALGRTEAIKSLRQYANRAEDAESIFLIVRLLFEPGNRQSRPDILVGRIYPNILEQDKLDWQYFPIALQDDIPFLVGRVTVSLGVPQDPEEHIDWAENHGIFRRTPLSPKTDPVTAAVRLLATEKMRRLMAANPDSDLSTFLRVQTVQSLNVGNTQIGNSWSKLQAELRRNPVSWAPSTQSFVSRE